MSLAYALNITKSRCSSVRINWRGVRRTKKTWTRGPLWISGRFQVWGQSTVVERFTVLDSGYILEIILVQFIDSTWQERQGKEKLAITPQILTWASGEIIEPFNKEKSIEEGATWHTERSRALLFLFFLKFYYTFRLFLFAFNAFRDYTEKNID